MRKRMQDVENFLLAEALQVKYRCIFCDQTRLHRENNSDYSFCSHSNNCQATEQVEEEDSEEDENDGLGDDNGGVGHDNGWETEEEEEGEC